MTARRRTLLVVVVLAVVGATGTWATFAFTDPRTGVDPVQTTEVVLVDEAFQPTVITVPSGSTVRWSWEGEEEHNVVGTGITSPVQVTGTFSRTFDQAGTFDYRCTLHALSMRGRVVVTG